jgi:hypothetical protein
MGFRISAVDLVALLKAKAVEIPPGLGGYEVFTANANLVNKFYLIPVKHPMPWRRFLRHYF